MRISDWSADVCSSDLIGQAQRLPLIGQQAQELRRAAEAAVIVDDAAVQRQPRRGADGDAPLHRVDAPVPDIGGGGNAEDRQSVVQGKSVAVSVDLGGRRIIQKKKTKEG